MINRNDSACQTPGHLSCSDLGRAQNAGPSLRVCGVPQYLNLSGLDLGSAGNPGPASDSSRQSNLEPKQCRQGKHTRHELGQTQCGQDTGNTPHRCQCHLFAAFLHHHSPTEQIRSVTQSCLTLCNTMNRSTPGLPVHHQLPEFTQTPVHRVSDAIQPSQPLSSPSPPATNPSQHQSLFQ